MQTAQPIITEEHKSTPALNEKEPHNMADTGAAEPTEPKLKFPTNYNSVIIFNEEELGIQKTIYIGIHII